MNRCFAFNRVFTAFNQPYIQHIIKIMVLFSNMVYRGILGDVRLMKNVCQINAFGFPMVDNLSGLKHVNAPDQLLKFVEP